MAARDQLALGKAQAKRNNQHQEDTLLRCGLAICGYCGRNLIATHARGTGYHCILNGPGQSLFISAHLLDTAVWEQVKNIYGDPSVIVEELEKLKDDPAIGQLEELHGQVAAIDRKRANLVQSLERLDTDEEREPVINHLKRLTTQKQAMLAQQEALRQQHTIWQGAQSQAQHLEQWCRQVATRLETLSYQEKRRAMLALGSRSTCTGSNMSLGLRWRSTSRSRGGNSMPRPW